MSQSVGKVVLHRVCPRDSNGNSGDGGITFEEKVLKLGHALYPPGEGR